MLAPGDDGLGWLAQSGHVPLGYLGDADKTARTFPVIDGVRYSVPGDRARLRADGVIELLGRDSVTINSGGEKIFAEEVEHAPSPTTPPCTTSSSSAGRASAGATRSSPSCSCARASRRPTTSCSRRREQHIARYKLPKAFVFLDEIVRSPAGQGRLPLGQGPGRGQRLNPGASAP